MVCDAPLAEPGITEEVEGAGAFDWDEVEFDWDSEQAEEIPADEPDVFTPDATELPHVPALIFGDQGDTPEGEVQDIDLTNVELPDWLSEVRPDSGDGEGSNSWNHRARQCYLFLYSDYTVSRISL